MFHISVMIVNTYQVNCFMGAASRGYVVRDAAICMSLACECDMIFSSSYDHYFDKLEFGIFFF